VKKAIFRWRKGVEIEGVFTDFKAIFCVPTKRENAVPAAAVSKLPADSLLPEPE
jgi:hypothetical protein